MTDVETLEFATIALPGLHFAEKSNKGGWFGGKFLDEINTSSKILRELAVFRPLLIARRFFSCIG